jgi:site-specific DNA recombinase
MKRCVAYCRVSTNHKDLENSYENQKNYFEREINKNNEYTFAGIYADKGISGTKLNRPEFDRMISDAGLDIIAVRNHDGDNRKSKAKYTTVPSSTREPKFDLILVKSVARFARNVLAEDILRDLAKVGVFVKFLDLGKSTENNAAAEYTQFFLIFAEGESRKKTWQYCLDRRKEESEG